jgi:hypothetical protein
VPKTTDQRLYVHDRLCVEACSRNMRIQNRSDHILFFAAQCELPLEFVREAGWENLKLELW